jgi:MFS family permease
MLLLSPVVSALALYTATNYGFLYLLFTTTTEVFQEQYGFNASSAGLTFLGGGVGQVLGLIGFGLASDKLLLYLAKDGEKKPEHRLPPAIIGAFFVPLGFLWYGWTAEYRCHWILPVIGTFWIGLGMILIFTPVAAYLVDSFPQYAASAAAANTVLRSLGGALLPLCGSKMYDALGLGWGNSLLALIGIALIPGVILFYKRGEAIRTHPRFQLEL